MRTDINIKQRRFPVALARQICIAIYGANPSQQAWGNWRKWAKVPAHSRIVSYEQMCLLAAIASIRKKKPREELAISEIKIVANCPKLAEAIGRSLDQVDKEGVLGSDVPFWLSSHGIQIHNFDLYNKIKGFSMKQVYPEDLLLRTFAPRI
jgi:hypothetical protein